MVKDLIKEIKDGLTQVSSSQRDEIRVMREMLNDTEYSVDIYGKDGVTNTYCPSEMARGMFANVVHDTTKISKDEAKSLVDGYQFKNNTAEAMVQLSKQFVNTYVETNRKLNLGGTATSSVSLSGKTVEATTRTFPSKVGVNDAGEPIYNNVPVQIPAYTSIKVHGPCPSWVK